MHQPCNPTFIQARDAILKAENLYYGGVYNCYIWRAFAKRGLGINANPNGYINGFDVPKKCSPPFAVLMHS